jgi:hypothetical protein
MRQFEIGKRKLDRKRRGFSLDTKNIGCASTFLSFGCLGRGIDGVAG